MFCCCFKYIFVISVRRIISTSTGPIQRRRHWTNLHEICKIARILAVDERSDNIFSILQGMLPWQPIWWAKSTPSTHRVVRMTFARAAPPAYDKKSNCYAGRRQTNYLTRWTQANQLANQLTIINKRRGDKRMGYRQALPCV